MAQYQEALPALLCPLIPSWRNCILCLGCNQCLCATLPTLRQVRVHGILMAEVRGAYAAPGQRGEPGLRSEGKFYRPEAMLCWRSVHTRSERCQVLSGNKPSSSEPE